MATVLRNALAEAEALGWAKTLKLCRVNTGKGWAQFTTDPFDYSRETVTLHTGGSPHVVVRDHAGHVVVIKRF